VTSVETWPEGSRPMERLSILRHRVARKDIWRPLPAGASFVGMSDALLLAEPEETTRAFLERHLTQDGFDVVEAEGGEALKLLEEARPDLVLIGEPEGPELCRRLREGEPGRSWDRQVPVILLGESDPLDRVRAFERGCDDYLDRPFFYDELVARIRAVLRRAAPCAAERLDAGGIQIDRPTRRVTVNGERVNLPTKEFELLLKLAGDPYRVFTKEQLLREVWGFRSIGRTRTLDSHASRLRRRLNAPGRALYVQNVWGVGYCLLGD
jgi:DNA-binding response OmpR family regulator